MEENCRPVTYLDSVTSGDSLEILKASIPYLPPKAQQVLALYIKWRELSNVISYFRHPCPDLSMMSAREDTADPEQMLLELQKHAQGPFKESIDSMLFTLNAIQLFSANQELFHDQEDTDGKQLDE